ERNVSADPGSERQKPRSSAGLISSDVRECVERPGMPTGALHRSGYCSFSFSSSLIPKAKIVVELKVCPAFRTVEGKFGWFGAFGKCWASNVYPAVCRYVWPLMPTR